MKKGEGLLQRQFISPWHSLSAFCISPWINGKRGDIYGTQGNMGGKRKEPLNPKALLSVFYAVLYNLIFLDSECWQCHTLGQLWAVLLTHIMILVIFGAMKYTHSQLICLSMFLLNVTYKIISRICFFSFSPKTGSHCLTVFSRLDLNLPYASDSRDAKIKVCTSTTN